MRLFKHAAVAMGLQGKYDCGDLQATDFFQRSCDCVIGIEKGKENVEKGGMYPDKNTIKDFIQNATKPTIPTKEDDGMPF
jgi:hypothetical protein